MYKHFSIVLVILCNIHDSSSEEPKAGVHYSEYGEPPKWLPNRKEHYWIHITRLYKLNMLIFKDVILKVRLAEKLQEKYKGSLAYELGIITAGILETFRDMLDTYYFYTKADHWKSSDWQGLNKMVACYIYIHGCYMEILTDKDMYQAVLDEYNAKKRAKEAEDRDRMIQAFKKQHLSTVFRPFATIRRNADLGMTPPSDTEYKRMLRLKKWGEKWNYFDPIVEGIDINVRFDKESVKKAMKMKKL